MAHLELIETSLVLAIFGGYLILWAAKRRSVRRQTGIDPEVFGTGGDPLQQYMAQVARLLTGAVVLLIVAHALGWRGSAGLQPVGALDSRWVDAAGLVTGLLGLVICHVAQRTMGAAWRVGLDEQQHTELVTAGVFRYIRNPTYLGLFLINDGVWLIWPTWAVGTFVVVFFGFIEVQVRCEERHLLANHGSEYEKYMAQTKRYIPALY